MDVGQIVCGILFFILAAGAFIISRLQFTEKGYCFNNAYFWASREERKKLDENKEILKPHYRQSGFAFLFIGILCLMLAVYFATGWTWMLAASILACTITVVWAVVSSVQMERHQ